MKKLVLSLCLIVLMASSVFGATITFTIPDTQLVRVRTAILDMYPNNECATTNPDGSCATMKYTDSQWLKEVIRRYVVGLVYQSESNKARNQVNINIESEINKILLKDQNDLVQ